MSWTPEVYIGELRPWPESVRVVRGNSGETRRYEGVGRSEDGVERSSDGVDVTCAPDDYTAKLMAEVSRLQGENDRMRKKLEQLGDGYGSMSREHTQTIVELSDAHFEIDRLKTENASLRERITTQKQTVQAYRDDSREWREVAECAQTENAKLRELVLVIAYCMQYERECDGCRLNDADGTITAPVGCDGLLDRLRELGIEEG